MLKTITIHDTGEALLEITPLHVDDDGHLCTDDGDLCTDEDDDEDTYNDDADIASAMTSTASANAGDNDDGARFPTDPSAELEEESQKSISCLNVGDRMSIARSVYSDVFMLTAKTSSVEHEFVTLKTLQKSVLSATPGQYIYNNNNNVAAIRDTKVGERVFYGDGNISPIVGVCREIKTGLHNSVIVLDDIARNNVRASTFTQTISVITAQALLTSLRMFYRAVGFSSSVVRQRADYIVPVMSKRDLVVQKKFIIQLVV